MAEPIEIKVPEDSARWMVRLVQNEIDLAKDNFDCRFKITNDGLKLWTSSSNRWALVQPW